MTATLSALVNHQIRLAARPVGLSTASDWQLSAEPVAAPASGGVLVKVLALSLDPAMRGWMNEGRMKSKEDVVEGGVAAFPATLNKLFAGENFGKLVLRVAQA